MLTKEQLATFTDYDLGKLYSVVEKEVKKRADAQAAAERKLLKNAKRDLRKILRILVEDYFSSEKDLKVSVLRNGSLVGIYGYNIGSYDVKRFLESYGLEDVLCREQNDYGYGSNNRVKIRANRTPEHVMKALLGKNPVVVAKLRCLGVV